MAKRKVKKERTIKDMMGIFTLRMAGRNHSVKVLSILKSENFRVSMSPLFEALLNFAMKMGKGGVDLDARRAEFEAEGQKLALDEGLQGEAMEERAGAFVAEKMEGESVSGWLTALMPYFLGEGLTLFLSMPFEYAPELEEYRDECSDDELMDAAIEVFKRVFPLYLKLWKLKSLLPAGLFAGQK